MHVCGERDTAIIKKLVRDILLKCENNGYQSVAIPAICAGQYINLHKANLFKINITEILHLHKS